MMTETKTTPNLTPATHTQMIRKKAQDLFDATFSDKAGTTLEHKVLETIVGFRPTNFYYTHVISHWKCMLLERRGLVAQSVRGVGYRLQDAHRDLSGAVSKCLKHSSWKKSDIERVVHKWGLQNAMRLGNLEMVRTRRHRDAKIFSFTETGEQAAPLSARPAAGPKTGKVEGYFQRIQTVFALHSEISGDKDINEKQKKFLLHTLESAVDQ